MAKATNNIPNWKVSGDFFDVCKCNIPCPCTFAQTPTYGDCDGVLAYHLKRGNYGEITLDGLNLHSSILNGMWKRLTCEIQIRQFFSLMSIFFILLIS
jgi:hypothetical protein